MSQQLPRPEKLYFHSSAVFDTGLIFDFETSANEARYTRTMLAFLEEHYSQFKWSGGDASYELGGSVDNFSPPKVNSILRAHFLDTFQQKTFMLNFSGAPPIECRISDVWTDFYLFNAGILHIKIDIPPDVWDNAAVLSQVRNFLQKHDHPPEKFGVSIESLFGKSVDGMRQGITRAAHVASAPLLDTPYLNYVMLLGGVASTVRWSHSTMVALMPSPYDPDSQHFQSTLLNIHPDGIHNASRREGHFAFVESGDSLICVPNVEVAGRSAETIAYEEWVRLIGLHHYTWKMVWELDRGLYGVLNEATAMLKHKHGAEHFRDVYGLNALLNYIWLLLDTHKPHNMTLSYPAIYFLNHISSGWLTGNLIEGIYEKMDSLRNLIGQLNELADKRRARRLELFLTVVGVFSLGSLVLELLATFSFGQRLADAAIVGIVVATLTIFSLIAYFVSR